MFSYKAQGKPLDWSFVYGIKTLIYVSFVQIWQQKMVWIVQLDVMAEAVLVIEQVKKTKTLNSNIHIFVVSKMIWVFLYGLHTLGFSMRLSYLHETNDDRAKLIPYQQFTPGN